MAKIINLKFYGLNYGIFYICLTPRFSTPNALHYEQHSQTGQTVHSE